MLFLQKPVGLVVLTMRLRTCAASRDKGHHCVTNQTPAFAKASLPRGNDIPYCRRTMGFALTVTSAVMRCRFVIVMVDGGGL